MLFLDLALQGFKELSGSAQVKLRPGYNAVVTHQPNPEGLIEGILETLYAEGYDPAAVILAAPGAESTRGVLSLRSSTGLTFRILRDLVKGSVTLQKFDSATGAFDDLTKDVAATGQALRADAGLPVRKTYRKAFVLLAGELPSHNRSAAPVVAQMATGPVKVNVAKLRKRLSEIESEINEHKGVEDLEFEIDGLQKQKFEIEDELKLFQVDETVSDDAKRRLAAFSYLDIVPDDFEDRLQVYERAIVKRDSDLRRWKKERKIIKGEIKGLHIEPIQKNPLLWAGLLVGAVAIGAGFFLGDLWRYLAFIDIPAFGLSTFILYNSLEERQRMAVAKRRLKLSDDREQKIIGRDEERINEVAKIFEEARINDVEDARDAMAAKKQAADYLADVEKEKRDKITDPKYLELSRQDSELTAKIKAAEQRLSTMSSSPVDGGALRTEAADLRMRIQEAQDNDDEDTSSEIPESPADEPAEEGESELRALIDAGLDVFLSNRSKAAEALSATGSKLLGAMSDGRYTKIVLTPLGAARISTSDGGTTSYSRLPPGVQDLVYVAIKGSIMFSAEERARAPMIVGDLAPVLPGGEKAIRSLTLNAAKVGQVIHVVSRVESSFKPDATVYFQGKGVS